MVEVRGVFLDTFLLGVLVTVLPAGVLGVDGALGAALLALAEWNEGVTSFVMAVLSAWRQPNASSM